MSGDRSTLSPDSPDAESEVRSGRRHGGGRSRRTVSTEDGNFGLRSHAGLDCRVVLDSKPRAELPSCSRCSGAGVRPEGEKREDDVTSQLTVKISFRE